MSPLGPCGPVAPVAPAAPVSPLGPWSPEVEPVHLPVLSMTLVPPTDTDLGVMSPVALSAMKAYGTDCSTTRGVRVVPSTITSR